mmetsp:Transcript_25176/g.36533  ORF Transcript_25176/g.36533 Transcript_25176/m.36533 type:complete len:117 (+) Transcript_25176:239-589(+)
MLLMSLSRGLTKDPNTNSMCIIEHKHTEHQCTAWTKTTFNTNDSYGIISVAVKMSSTHKNLSCRKLDHPHLMMKNLKMFLSKSKNESQSPVAIISNLLHQQLLPFSADHKGKYHIF